MTKENLIEAVTENTEILLDSFLEDGLVKDVPVIGNLYKACKIATSIKDHFYKVKLTSLLKALDQVPQAFKDKLRNTLLEKPEETQELSTKLIMVLDSITDVSKSDFIANIFIAYLDAKITPGELRRMLDVINLAFIDDLLNFVRNYNGFMSYGSYTVSELEQKEMLSLVGVSLFRVVSVNNGEAESNGVKYEDLGITAYEYSELGRKFAKAYHFGKSSRGIQ
jgi:hypothetical protein